MKRRFLAAVALALAGPMLAYAGPDDTQRLLMQRAREAQSKLDAAQAAQGAQREKMIGDHLTLMQQMLNQMNSDRPGSNATPQQMREWIEEHIKLMDVMMTQMMQGERMMMGSQGSSMMGSGSGQKK